MSTCEVIVPHTDPAEGSGLLGYVVGLGGLDISKKCIAIPQPVPRYIYILPYFFLR